MRRQRQPAGLCWLIERLGPLPRPPRTARWAIALWPYLVVAWLLW
ncbi:hypothetical protein ULF88_16680 [Halopseudomonas pachastrellae]|nr:hypothetical protein [Halopseudomonas pachastrellae]